MFSGSAFDAKMRRLTEKWTSPLPPRLDPL